EELFEHPVHPYTRRLLATIPVVSERRALDPIPGQAPAPGSRPSGCFFAPRCAEAIPRCTEGEPPVVDIGAGHYARCLPTHDLVTERTAPTVAPHRERRSDEAEILSVDNLETFYGARQILFEVSMALHPQECLALVGESGSGKTTLARSIIGLATNWRG